MQKNLVYTLDDFGLSSSVDESTVASVNPSKIDRVAVVVGLYDLTPHLPFLSQTPKLDLHLNSTEPHERRVGARLVSRRLTFGTQYVMGGLRSEHIYRAWDEQIHMFQDMFGRLPDGLNSHEHVHMFPPLFKRVCTLAKEYGIPYVRLGQKSAGIQRAPLRDRIINTFRAQNLAELERANIHTSSALWSADGKLSQEILEKLPSGAEVILHPDIPSDMTHITI